MAVVVVPRYIFFFYHLFSTRGSLVLTIRCRLCWWNPGGGGCCDGVAKSTAAFTEQQNLFSLGVLWYVLYAATAAPAFSHWPRVHYNRCKRPEMTVYAYTVFECRIFFFLYTPRLYVTTDISNIFSVCRRVVVHPFHFFLSRPFWRYATDFIVFYALTSSIRPLLLLLLYNIYSVTIFITFLIGTSLFYILYVFVFFVKRVLSPL